MTARFQLSRLAAAAALASAPICIPQALRLRRTIPRLPEATGPRTGTVAGDGKPLRLLVFGESTAAGVGCETHDDALPGAMARGLQQRTGRPIEWHVVGKNGATAASALADLVPQVVAINPDLVMTALGGNDVMRLRSPERWRNDLHRLLAGLQRDVNNVPILLSGMPPVGEFPALPMPLRGVLHLRKRLLEQVTREVLASYRNIHYLTMDAPTDFYYYSSDRFHPGPLAYKKWGDTAAEAALSLLRVCCDVTTKD